MKKILSSILVFVVLVNIFNSLNFNKALAVTVLDTPSITNPDDGDEVEIQDITIKWSSVDAAEYYRLTIKDTTSGTTFVDNAKVTSRSYTLSSGKLKAGHTIKVAVGAYNNNGGESYWDYVSFSVVSPTTSTPTPTPTPVTTYRLSGYIKESSTGAALSGVTVKLNNSSNWTTTTNSSGYYEFNSLQASTHTLTATKTGYTDYQQNVDVYSNTTKNINMTGNVQKYRLSGYITDSSTGAALSGVTVKLNNSSNWTTTTSSSGYYEFNSLQASTHTLTATKTGYTDYQQNVDVYSNTAKNISMTGNVQKYRLSGYITDSSTGAALSGVTVKLNNSSNWTTTTSSSGYYEFNSLQASTHALTATKSGYTDYQQNVDVYSNTAKNISMTGNVQKYRLSGYITDSAGVALSGVTVKLNNSSNWTTTTNSSGYYEFNSLQASTHTLTATKTGYTDYQQNVDVFSNTTKNISMPSSVQKYKLSGYVTDSTGTALSGVTVKLDYSSNWTTTTSSSGYYEFNSVQASTHTMTATKSGYTDFQQNVDVYSNTSKSFKMDPIKVAAPVLNSDPLNKSTYKAGDTASFNGTIYSNGGTLEKLTVFIKGPNDKTISATYYSQYISGSSYDLSKLSSFKVGDTYMMRAGTYFIEVWAKNINGSGTCIKTQTITVTADASKFSISGVALNKYTGNPISGVNIQLNSESNWKMTTGSDGKFVFSGVADKTSHNLTAELYNYVLVDANGNQISKMTVNMSGANQNSLKVYMIDVKDKYEIYGKVIDSTTKKGVPGVKVTPENLTNFTVTSDSEGNYRMIGISSGFYSLNFVKDGCVAGTQNVTVSGKNIQQDLTILPKASLDGFVYVGNYFNTGHIETLKGAAVWLNTKSVNDAGQFVAKTDDKGQYKISGLAQTTQIIYAQYYGYVPKNLDMRVTPQSSAVSYDIIMIPEKNVPSEWAKTVVTNAYNYGLLTESTKVDFRGEITRLEFCELVMNLYTKLGGKSVAAASAFTDCTNNSVLQAKALGIVKGSGDNFYPNSAISRQDVCVILNNMLKVMYPGLESNANGLGFKDNTKISDYAKSAVAFATSKSIVSGSDGSFNPLNNTSREQAIKIVMQTYLNRNSIFNSQKKTTSSDGSTQSSSGGTQTVDVTEIVKNSIVQEFYIDGELYKLIFPKSKVPANISIDSISNFYDYAIIVNKNNMVVVDSVIGQKIEKIITFNTTDMSNINDWNELKSNISELKKYLQGYIDSQKLQYFDKQLSSLLGHLVASEFSPNKAQLAANFGQKLLSVVNASADAAATGGELWNNTYNEVMFMEYYESLTLVEDKIDEIIILLSDKNKLNNYEYCTRITNNIGYVKYEYTNTWAAMEETFVPNLPNNKVAYFGKILFDCGYNTATTIIGDSIDLGKLDSKKLLIISEQLVTAAKSAVDATGSFSGKLMNDSMTDICRKNCPTFDNYMTNKSLYITEYNNKNYTIAPKEVRYNYFIANGWKIIKESK